MGYYLPETASGQPNLTAKNRVWGFFGESVSVCLETRPAALETHQENYAGHRKTVSGIPLWPSRDPIGERGGLNLYGFVGHNAIERVDLFGLQEYGPQNLPISGLDIPSVNNYECCVGEKVTIQILIRQGAAGHVDTIGPDGIMRGLFTETGGANSGEASGAVSLGTPGTVAVHDPSQAGEDWYEKNRPQYVDPNKAKMEGSTTMVCTRLVCAHIGKAFVDEWNKRVANPGTFALHNLGNVDNCAACAAKILKDSGASDDMGPTTFPVSGLQHKLQERGWNCKIGYAGYQDGKPVLLPLPQPQIFRPATGLHPGFYGHSGGARP